MAWVTRGLRDGIITTTWPHRPDAYRDGFATTATAREDAAPLDDEAAAEVVGLCPTDAISATDGRVTVDPARCILCGRCVFARPDLFTWQRGDPPISLTSGSERDSDLDELRARLARKVRHLGRSVHIRHVDAGSDGSDEWEVHALTNPVYDIHRLGIFFTASPRHADILLVTGIGAAGMVEPLHRTRVGMPDPVVVIAAGTDAASGGLIGATAGAGSSGIGDLIDVDVWVPGAPASPFALMEAILTAIGKLPVASAHTAGGGTS